MIFFDFITIYVIKSFYFPYFDAAERNGVAMILQKEASLGRFAKPSGRIIFFCSVFTAFDQFPEIS